MGRGEGEEEEVKERHEGRTRRKNQTKRGTNIKEG